MTFMYESRALLNVDMPSWYYDGVTAKTRNLGSLAGTVQLGDGTTVGTFPTQVLPHGMSFSGASTQYLSVTNAAFNFTAGGVDQPFSCEILLACTFVPAAYAYLFSNEIGTAGGWSIIANNGGYYFYFRDNALNNFYTITPGGIYGSTKNHLVAVYDGTMANTGQTLYLNGAARAVSRSATGVYTGLPATGNPVLICRSGSAAYPAYNIAIYPFALQPGEVAQLYRQRLGLLNRGF